MHQRLILTKNPYDFYTTRQNLDYKKELQEEIENEIREYLHLKCK